MSLLKTPFVNPLWRRSAVAAVRLDNFSSIRRRTLAAFSQWPRSARHNSGGGGTYFQNGFQKSRQLTGSQSSDGVSGPIYVLPSDNRSRSYMGFLYFTLGMFSGAALLFFVVDAMVPYLDKDTERQRSMFPRLDSDSDDADAVTASYAEAEDGSEMPRDPFDPEDPLPSLQVLALEKQVVLQKLWHLREAVEKEEKLVQVMELLNSSNNAQLKVHKVLLDLLLNPQYSVILDNALLESRPIVLPDSTRLNPSNASLIRVVDDQDKNKMLLLGIDLDWHESNRKVAAQFPSDAYELDQWLLDLANELEHEGANAQDLAIYLYSNRVIIDVNLAEGSRWMTRYNKSEFAPGFPLLQMKQIKKVAEPNSNLNNLTAKADGSKRDREAS